MKGQFYKYQAAGNDFILMDNRDEAFPRSDRALVQQLCQRHFGIGSDGLILLENHPNADFKMVFLNPDGRLASMCGNGGKCIVAFARDLGLIDSQTVFAAGDGMHRAAIVGDRVELQMKDVYEVAQREGALFLDTGSSHHVAFFDCIQDIDVPSEGKKTSDAIYGEVGANVNFAQCHADGSISVRTYERGVEDETLACGTGAIATALAAFEKGLLSKPALAVKMRGGDLPLRFTQTDRGYEDICLIGPAQLVFKGEWIAAAR